MKLAVICSAGGASVFQGYDIAVQNGLSKPEDILLISDRECGAETAAQQRGVSTHRIVFENRAKFSSEALSCAQKFGASAVLLAYSRLVGPELFTQIPTLNIHPSRLPAFPGLGAVQAARKNAVSELGASLHIVDEGIDSGALLAQVRVSAPSPNAELDVWNQLSFVLKAYLAAMVFEKASEGSLTDAPESPDARETTNASPALGNPRMIAGFDKFLRSRGMENFTP